MKIYRVIDFETTGFPPGAGIVEVGWTDVFEDKVISMEPKWHGELCNPQIPINVEAQAVHHISAEDIQDARAPEGILTEIQEGADYFVAHNAAFECKFFMPEKAPYICTMKAAQKIIPEAPGFSNQVLRYHLGVDKDPRFDPAMAMPPHRAGPDTYVTGFLLMELLKKGFTGEQLVEFTGPPALHQVIPFGKHKGKEWKNVPRDYIMWLLSQGPQEDIRASIQHYLGIGNPRDDAEV